jgi:hypothetical protein
MKRKMELIAIAFAILICFSHSSNAQTPNSTAPKYGSWIFTDGRMSRYDHFKPTIKFPPAIFSRNDYGYIKYTVPSGLQSKLVKLRDIFVPVNPKPFLHSITYSYLPLRREYTGGTIPFKFQIGDYPFFYDSQGNLKPINPMSQLGRMSGGYCSVEINAYPSLESNNPNGYIKAIEGKDFYGIKTLNVIPPQVIAMEYAKGSNTLKPFEYALPKAANSPAVKWFTNIERDNGRSMQDKVEETVVISYNNQLPYVALSKLQFLELLAIAINYRKDETLKVNKFITIEKGYKEKDIIAAENRLKALDDQLALVQQIKRNNQSTINEKAIINPFYRKLLYETGMIAEFINNKNDRGARAKKNEYNFSDLFISNERIGYQMAFPDPNYYSKATANDIKTITVKWTYITRLPQHKLFGLNYEQEKATGDGGTPSRMWSDEPNSFMEGMLKRLDWTKLEELLTR